MLGKMCATNVSESLINVYVMNQLNVNKNYHSFFVGRKVTNDN